MDAGAIYQGWYSDMARTYAVGEISPEAAKLVRVTEESFFEGLKYCVAGNYLSDVSHAIQVHLESNGFGVIRDYVGHVVSWDGYTLEMVRDAAANGSRPAQNVTIHQEQIATLKPVPERRNTPPRP